MGTSIFMSFALFAISFVVIHVYGHDDFSAAHAAHLQRIKTWSMKLSSAPTQSPTPTPTPTPSPSASRVYHVTSYGADPTGNADSTDAIIAALSDALRGPGNGFLVAGIANLGGARVDLDGGIYLISRPIQFPVAGKGNMVIHGGSLKASDNFPSNGYMIDLSPASENGSGYNYEFVTLRDLFLDSNLRGGGIQVVNSLRTSIDNCYVTGFNTTGILVKQGHETYIRNSYLGQHITAGGDPGEREFSGTGIELMGNDNSITDVVIFSAATGIIISGQANTISGVHCYNKANGFGGVGIYLRLPGLTQTRIINSYFDYTGIVAEDPVQLTITNSFFLGDAFVLFKSVKGMVNGVNVVDNMFSGSNKEVEIVQLDQSNGPFNQVDQVIIHRNNVNGMKLKATVVRGEVQGNGRSWMADLNSVLVFPNLIKQVQYSLITNDNSSFPVHALRSVSDNRVVVEADVTVNASVYVSVDQGSGFLLA